MSVQNHCRFSEKYTTATENQYDTLTALCNLGNFERGKPILCVVLWVEGTFLSRFRFFQRGTVILCSLKGFKIVVHQTLRMILFIWPASTYVVCRWPSGRIFFKLPTLTACKFAALWSIEVHSTSLERSQPLKLIFEWENKQGFIYRFCSLSDPIYVGLN